MLTGIRNIIIFNTVVVVFCGLNFYLPFSAEHWAEIKTSILLSALFLIVTAASLLFRSRYTWHFVRFLCYFNALIFVLYFISLVGKGVLISFPVQSLFYLVLGVYFIGIRGYLNTDKVRGAYGIARLSVTAAT